MMKVMLITQLVKLIMSLLTPDLLKKFADLVLDFVEDHVEGTKSEVDDRLVLPLCGLIRSTFDLPDND